MEFRFNRTGAERKVLVEAVSEIVGCAPVYMKAPTFAYAVGSYTIDSTGTLILDGQVSAKDARSLLTALAERGFDCEDRLDGDFAAAAPDEQPENTSSEDNPQDTDSADNHAPDRLSIEVPLEGFTDTALSNLDKLITSKAALIRKAIGTSDLSTMRADDRLCFPWFSPQSSVDEVGAYSRFVHALCEMAKKQKRVIAKEKPADSEKFAFRCFLLRLGFIGEEYAPARKILLANLPGDGSFKSGKRKDSVELTPGEDSFNDSTVPEHNGELVGDSADFM